MAVKVRIILAGSINRIAQHSAHMRRVRALLSNMLTVAIEPHARAIGQQSTIEHLRTWPAVLQASRRATRASCRFVGYIRSTP